MDFLTLAIVAAVYSGVSAVSIIGAIFFLGYLNRRRLERAEAQAKADHERRKLEASVAVENHRIAQAHIAANNEAEAAKVKASFDSMGMVEALRMVTESVQAHSGIIQRHAEILQEQHGHLGHFDAALVEFQRREALAAHAIQMIQEAIRDLTAITSQGLPSGKMFPSVNDALNRVVQPSAPPPTNPTTVEPKTGGEEIIIDDPDFIPPEDMPAIAPPYPPPVRPEAAVPQAPTRMPPPFPKPKAVPKGRKR